MYISLFKNVLCVRQETRHCIYIEKGKKKGRKIYFLHKPLSSLSTVELKRQENLTFVSQNEEIIKFCFCIKNKRLLAELRNFHSSHE